MGIPSLFILFNFFAFPFSSILLDQYWEKLGQLWVKLKPKEMFAFPFHGLRI